LDPLPVRCWAQVQQHEGFDTVTYFLETPQDAPKTEIGGGSGYGWDRLPRLGNVAVSRWDIVVTDAKVRPVSAIARADTVSNGGWEQDYAWVRGAWHEDGAGACGGERLAIWFTGAGFPVSWLGGCDVSGRMGPPRGMVEGGPVTAHLPGGRVVITTGSVPSERPRSRSR
jgi:hypothetical protein